MRYNPPAPFSLGIRKHFQGSVIGGYTMYHDTLRIVDIRSYGSSDILEGMVCQLRWQTMPSKRNKYHTAAGETRTSASPRIYIFCIVLCESYATE